MALDPAIWQMISQLGHTEGRGGSGAAQGAADAVSGIFAAFNKDKPKTPSTPYQAMTPDPEVMQNPFAGPRIEMGLGPQAIVGPGQVTTYTPGQGDPKMEGGRETSSGAPMYYLEDYLDGHAPYVTVAAGKDSPFAGKDLTLTLANGTPIRARATDYGPGVKTLDVASRNPAYAKNAPSIFDQVGIAHGWGAAPTPYRAMTVQSPYAAGQYPTPGGEVPKALPGPFAGSAPQAPMNYPSGWQANAMSNQQSGGFSALLQSLSHLFGGGGGG